MTVSVTDLPAEAYLAATAALAEEIGPSLKAARYGRIAATAAAPYIAAAERGRIGPQLEDAITRQLDPLFAALGELLRVVADECPLTDAVMAAADNVRAAMVLLGMRDIGPPP